MLNDWQLDRGLFMSWKHFVVSPVGSHFCSCSESSTRWVLQKKEVWPQPQWGLCTNLDGIQDGHV